MMDGHACRIVVMVQSSLFVRLWDPPVAESARRSCTVVVQLHFCTIQEIGHNLKCRSSRLYCTTALFENQFVFLRATVLRIIASLHGARETAAVFCSSASHYVAIAIVRMKEINHQEEAPHESPQTW